MKTEVESCNEFRKLKDEFTNGVHAELLSTAFAGNGR